MSIYSRLWFFQWSCMHVSSVKFSWHSCPTLCNPMNRSIRGLPVHHQLLESTQSWTIKKTEHRRIDAFELWCWRSLLTVPWTARRSNQSILKEISLGCSLEGLMLKLKFQCFGHLIQTADSLEKTLILGKIGDRRRRKQQRRRGLDGITDSMDMTLGELQELVMDRRPGMLQFMRSQRVGQDLATELNWKQISKKKKKKNNQDGT